jgi:Mg2+/Co2+ transporter CorC
VRRVEGYVRPVPPALLGVLAGLATVVALVVGAVAGVVGVVVVTPLVVVGAVLASTAVAERQAGRHWPGADEPDQSDLEQDEREMIESVIDFGDTIAREAMVPRPDMVTVAATFRVADVMEIMLLNGYSRLPACGHSSDDIVGLVYAKDLMRAERDGKEDRPVAELLRPATFVPETKRLPELLREMQQNQFHMAIVIDEYGGTAGLVTLEDIIEELVGEIFDEYDVEDPMIEPLPGGDALVRGRTPVDEVNDLIDAALPEGDWDTVGGLIYSRLGHIPVEGETVDVDGWRLTAQRIQGRRIGRVRMTRLGRDQPSADEMADDADGDESANGTEGGLNGHLSIGREHPEDSEHLDDTEDRPVRERERERHRADDQGAVGGVEALPLGVLIFVIGTLLIANVWAVVDAKMAVDAAAREATRRYVEAVDGAGAEGAAVAAGLAALEAHGRDPGRAEVRLEALATPDGRAAFERCARATFRASYHVPALSLPLIGGYGRGFEVTSSHSELVDPFRDGVPGDASAC